MTSTRTSARTAAKAAATAAAMSAEPVGVRNGRRAPLSRMTLPVGAVEVRHGLGAFETVRVRRGRAALLGLHAERLVVSLRRMRLPCPWDARTAWRWGVAAIAAAGIPDGVLRLVASAAGPTLDAWVELSPPRSPAPCRLTARAAPRASGSPLAGLKALSWADHALLRREAREAGFDDALLVSGEWEALETTTANLFLVERDGVLVTPHIDRGVLPGITRALLLRLAPGLDLTVREEAVPLGRLLAAEEAFVTSALAGVVPLAGVDGRSIGGYGAGGRGAGGCGGPVTDRLAAAWRSLAE